MIKKLLPCFCLLLLIQTGFSYAAYASTIDFEGLDDLTAVTNQYASLGITFSGATVLTAGMSLNEFEFPPHSGSNVAFDETGPISISFASPVSSFGAYFTYAMPVTVEAYDSGANLVGLATSAFFANMALSGDLGSSPNEFLQIIYAGGISSLTITGDADFGGSFTMDDVTYDSSTPIPEPSTIFLIGTCVIAMVVAKRRIAR